MLRMISVCAGRKLNGSEKGKEQALSGLVGISERLHNRRQSHTYVAPRSLREVEGNNIANVVIRRRL
jgi:hypothetical protein